MVLRRLAPCLALLTLALPQSAAAAPTWLPPKNLSVSGNGGDLTVAVDAGGDAFAAWTRSGTVQAAERPAGETWSAAHALSDNCLGAHSVRLAVNAAGRAVVVWECSEGGNTSVQASTRAAGRSWSGPHDLSAPGQDAHVPHVARDRARDALAVWARPKRTDRVLQGSLPRPTRGRAGEPTPWSRKSRSIRAETPSPRG